MLTQADLSWAWPSALGPLNGVSLQLLKLPSPQDWVQVIQVPNRVILLYLVASQKRTQIPSPSCWLTQRNINYPQDHYEHLFIYQKFTFLQQHFPHVNICSLDVNYSMAVLFLGSIVKQNSPPKLCRIALQLALAKGLEWALVSMCKMPPDLSCGVSCQEIARSQDT